MDKAETDNQKSRSSDACKNCRPVIAAIAGVFVLVLAVVGLNLVGLISLPFLPKSPELVLLRAIGDVAHDGTFDVVADADTDAELSIEALGQEAKSNVRLTATATGTAYDFDANDPSKLKIPDGAFAVDTMFALDVGFLQGETENLHASGTFDLALDDEVINYHLQEPFDYEGVIQFDTQALMGQENRVMMRGIALSDIHDMKMEGDKVTFTVNTASIDTSTVPDALKEILQLVDIDLVDAQTNLSNLDVSVDLGTPSSVRAHVTGTMDVTAQGRKRVDLPLALPVVPVNIDLKINVPIDINFVLS